MLVSHPRNVHLLLNDYAGADSELTAILQYLHHHFVVEYNDVAEMLEDFAEEEMRHFETLGTIIRQYGIDPRIYDAQKRYWGGSDVDYQYNVCQILRVNLAGEIGAVYTYYLRITQIQIPSIQDALRDIISDELGHVRGLTRMLRKYCPRFNLKDWLRRELKRYPYSPEIERRIYEAVNWHYHSNVSDNMISNEYSYTDNQSNFDTDINTSGIDNDVDKE